MSCARVAVYATPLVVMIKPSLQRALTLPDLPRLRPQVFICRAVATISPRSARCSATRQLRKERGEPRRRCRAKAALGDEPGQQAPRGDVECRVEDRRTVRGDRLAAGWI